MLQESLQKLGFSNKEAGLYIQMVHLGAQPVSVLAKHAGLNRTTAYDLLETLMARGLVTFTKKKGRTLCQALHPSQLVNFLEREKQEFERKITRQKRVAEEILPELISLENPNSTKPKVTFYEGENGLREAYEDTLTSHEPIRAYANVEDMHKGLPNFFPEYYFRRAVEKKIAIRAIMPDNKGSRDRTKYDAKERRKSILIPQSKYDFSPEINIYDDKVLIASWREKLAIIIQSREIADFHKKMYELCWQSLSAAK